MIPWLLTNALTAMALAVLAGLIIWAARPGPAVRHALWLVVLFKLVSPGGLVWSVPLPFEAPDVAVVKPQVPALPAAPPSVPDRSPVIVEAEIFTVLVDRWTGRPVMEIDEERQVSSAVADPSTDAVPTAPSVPMATPPNYAAWAFGLWCIGAVLIGGRQARDTWRFHRFVCRAYAAPDWLVAEVAIVANRLNVRVPTVRVLPGLSSPLMWCLWRPELLWPAGLEKRLSSDGRRAVLAHELAHLRRRDHWARRLEMVAAVLHWWNPLFWIARRHMRADAELACDAWAAGQVDRRAYAEALLEVCSYKPRCRRPAPAVGVVGEGKRAMQTRLTMIMRESLPCRLAFGAKLFVALMALAAVPAWTLGQGTEAPKPEPTEIAAEALADPAQVIEAEIKALHQKIEALKAAKAGKASKATKTEKAAKADKTKLEVKDVLIELATEEAEVPKICDERAFKIIGPDGKERKDIKVIVVDGASGKVLTPPGAKAQAAGTKGIDERFVQVLIKDDLATAPPTPDVRSLTPAVPVLPPAAKTPVRVHLQGQDNLFEFHYADGGDAKTVTLSRATYKVSKEQATALAALLTSVKTTVMETKVDGESITVTTTPEAQGTVGAVVGLITGHPQQHRFSFRTNVAPASVPVRIEAPATSPLKVLTLPAGAKPTEGSFIYETPAAPLAPEKPTTPPAVKNPLRINFTLDPTKLVPAVKVVPVEKKPEAPAK